jgi:hypothetical protein
MQLSGIQLSVILLNVVVLIVFLLHVTQQSVALLVSFSWVSFFQAVLFWWALFFLPLAILLCVVLLSVILMSMTLLIVILIILLIFCWIYCRVTLVLCLRAFFSSLSLVSFSWMSQPQKFGPNIRPKQTSTFSGEAKTLFRFKHRYLREIDCSCLNSSHKKVLVAGTIKAGGPTRWYRLGRRADKAGGLCQ